jgi:hypothetical protein
MEEENKQTEIVPEKKPHNRKRPKNGRSIAYRKVLLEKEREREKKRIKEKLKHEKAVLRRRRARRRATLRKHEKKKLQNIAYKKRLLIKRAEKIKLRNKRDAERRKLRTIKERERDKKFLEPYIEKRRRMKTVKVPRADRFIPKTKYKKNLTERIKTSRYATGKPINKVLRYVPYEYAAMYIKTLKLESYRAYLRWHRDNGVCFIPKKPNSHYAEWDGWNAFLGNNNVYIAYDKAPKNALPYWDAVRWAQKFTKQHNITTQAQWLRFVRSNREEIPEGIPSWPVSFYKEEWKGWKVWFGKNIDAIVTANQNKKILMVLCNDTENPSNVIYPIFSEDGIYELRDKLAEHNLKPVMNSKIYELTESEHNLTQYIFEAHGTIQGNNWIFKNVYELIFELDSAFAWYTG